MSFQEWWAEHGSLDYDEMAMASDAWNYQQKRIAELENKLLRTKKFSKLQADQLALCAKGMSH